MDDLNTIERQDILRRNIAWAEDRKDRPGVQIYLDRAKEELAELEAQYRAKGTPAHGKA